MKNKRWLALTLLLAFVFVTLMAPTVFAAVKAPSVRAPSVKAPSVSKSITSSKPSAPSTKSITPAKPSAPSTGGSFSTPRDTSTSNFSINTKAPSSSTSAPSTGSSFSIKSLFPSKSTPSSSSSSTTRSFIPNVRPTTPPVTYEIPKTSSYNRFPPVAVFGTPSLNPVFYHDHYWQMPWYWRAWHRPVYYADSGAYALNPFGAIMTAIVLLIVISILFRLLRRRRRVY